MAAPNEYPTWEQRPNNLDISSDWCRIRWYLRGPLADSVHVLRDATDPNSAQDAYESNGTTHSIADSSLTLPPISAITVSTGMLNHYPDDWRSAHHEHADEEGDHVAWDDQGKLVRCCGENMPDPGPTLQVRAVQGQFVTIGAYIEAVHPWLEQLQSRLRIARGLHSGMPLSEEFDFIVYPLNPGKLYIFDTETKKGPVLNMEWTRLAKYAVKKQQQAAERGLTGLRIEGDR